MRRARRRLLIPATMPPKRPAAEDAPAKEKTPGGRRDHALKQQRSSTEPVCVVSSRRPAPPQGSSIHRGHGEGGAERSGLPQRGLIPGRAQLHQAEIPLGRRGEAETPCPPSSEEGDRVGRVGAPRHLQCDVNAEVQGNLSGMGTLRVPPVLLFNLFVF